ncbi:hypothetical protein LTS10_005936 [Elasticomyces elasticus]|nr:hypothetical protein LTS10_005936 [Elasticomyces elasticus]
MVDGRHSTRRAVKAGRASLVSADASAVATSSQRPSKRAAPKKEGKQPSAAIAEPKRKLDIDSEAPAAKRAKTTKAAAKSKARPKKAVVKAGEAPVKEQAPVEQEPKPEPEKPKKAAPKTAKTPKSTGKKVPVKAGEDAPKEPPPTAPAQPEQLSTAERGPVKQPKPQATRPTVETKTEPAITENAPVAKTPDTLSPDDIERVRAKVKEELAASRGQPQSERPASLVHTPVLPPDIPAASNAQDVHSPQDEDESPTDAPVSKNWLNTPLENSTAPPEFTSTLLHYAAISAAYPGSYLEPNTVSPNDQTTSPKDAATSPTKNEVQSPKYTASASTDTAYGTGQPTNEALSPHDGNTAPKDSAALPIDGYAGSVSASGLETAVEQAEKPEHANKHEPLSPTYPQEPLTAPYSGEDPFSIPSSSSSTNGNPPTTYAGDSPDVSGLQPAGVDSPNDPGTDVGEDFSSLFDDGTPPAKKEEQVVDSKPAPALALPKAAPAMVLPGLRFGQPSIVPAETATKKVIDVMDDNGNLLFSTPAKEEAVDFSASAQGSEHRQPSVEDSEDEGNGWRAEGWN